MPYFLLSDISLRKYFKFVILLQMMSDDDDITSCINSKMMNNSTNDFTTDNYTWTIKFYDKRTVLVAPCTWLKMYSKFIF